MQPNEPTFDEMKFYDAEDLAAAVGRSVKNVYHHFANLRSRELEKPLPDRFPLDGKNANRLYSYLVKIRKN